MYLGAKTWEYGAELDTAVDKSASCSPSQATENYDNIQRESKDIYNKDKYSYAM